MEVNIIIVIPVLLPYPIEGIDDICAETRKQIKKICYSLDFFYGGLSKINPKKLSKKQEKNFRKTFFQFRHVRPFELIAFETIVNYESDKINFDFEPQMSEESKYGYFLSSMVSDIEFSIYGLCLATNIARPGTFSFDKTVIFAEKYSYFDSFSGLNNSCYFNSFPGLNNSLDMITLFEHNFDYPKVNFFDVVEVWDWLKSFEDFDMAFGKTPLGRGLAAFSHLFLDGTNAVDSLDLWAIIGLESLYKSNGSKRELLTKIQLFLGENTRLKSVIDEIYGVRSAFVHGGMNFPFMFCPYDAMEDYKKYTDKSISLEKTTVALLVATLQKMYSLNLFDIEFEYHLKST
jgi:hypothetical protein